MTFMDRMGIDDHRRLAEERFLDSFSIGTPADGWVLDPWLGVDVQAVDVFLETVGRVKSTDSVVPRSVEVGGRTAVETVRVLSIPWDSPVVPSGSVAVCTAVHWSSDPTLLGARFRVVGPAPGSQSTARRLTIEEVVA